MSVLLAVGPGPERQQTRLNHFARADRHLAWIHLAFLAGVAIMPFSTDLLAEFIAFRVGLVTYRANIVVWSIAFHHARPAQLRDRAVDPLVVPDVEAQGDACAASPRTPSAGIRT